MRLRSPASIRRALLLLTFTAGLGGVVYEVLYLRHLTTWLGDMYYVHAAVLSVFLLGAGIGAYLAHRAVRYLAVVELGIGGYALVLPWLSGVFLASRLARPFEDPVLDALLASLVLLATPAVLIGFSIPLFSTYLQNLGRDDRSFQATYGLYHVGTCISVLTVEFLLVRSLGIRASLYVLGALDLLCAAVLLVVPRVRLNPPAEPTTSLWSRESGALLLASVASAVFQGFQLKICYGLFHPHRENFAICTAVSLLGLATGAFLVRRFRWQVATCWLGALCSIAAIYAAYPEIAAAYRWFAELMPAIAQRSLPVAGAALVAGKILWALLLGGVPMTFIGASIPALIEGNGEVARNAGRLLLVAGVGNALGYLAYVLVVHPHVPLFSVIAIVALLLVAALLGYGTGLGPAESWVRARSNRSGGRLARAAAGLALLVLVWVASAHPARVGYLARTPHAADSIIVHYTAASDDVSWIQEPTSSRIAFNGLPSITLERRGIQPASEVVGGIVPALVAPRRGRAMVLGLGSGVTAGAVALMFEHVDVVEINRAFVPLLPALHRLNFELAGNPRARIVIDDARRHLAHAALRYDVILNATPSPSYYSAGKIYTREFFELARASLAEGGVFISWFTPDTMSVDSIRTLLATQQSVFAHCGLVVLHDGGYRLYNTICGERPLRMPGAAALDIPGPLQQALAPLVPPPVLDRYLRCLVVSDDIGPVATATEPAINTDDLPVLEFQLSRLQVRATAPRADPIADGALGLRLNPLLSPELCRTYSMTDNPGAPARP